MKHLVIAIAAACGSTPAPVHAPAPEPTPIEATPPTSSKVSAPVPAGSKLSCDRLIDAAAFTTALGEREPLTIRDDSRQDPEAAAVCSLVRGGTRLSNAEQEKQLKQTGRLGVMAGDAMCQVSAYCWTIEDGERFAKRCAASGRREDRSMGSYACLEVVAAGADDVHVFRFFDEDTRCVLAVRGGPANVDNDSVRACAITARDTIDRGDL